MKIFRGFVFLLSLSFVLFFSVNSYAMAQAYGAGTFGDGAFNVGTVNAAPASQGPSGFVSQSEIQQLFPTATQSSNSSQQPLSFSRDLTTKSSGADVKSLQAFLINKGYLSKGSDIGYFGDMTKKALIKYQSDKGIKPAIGYFGPSTRQAVSADSKKTVTVTAQTPTKTKISFSHNLKLGMTDPDVVELQKFLNTHGFVISSTGAGSPGNETDKFGAKTVEALKKFQSKYASELLTPSGLTSPTGYFGPSTRAKVNQLIGQ